MSFYKLLRCNPEYFRQVCNRALKRLWRDSTYSCFVRQTWLLEIWHRKCGKIPGSLKSMATFVQVSMYACFHKLTKTISPSGIQILNPTCFWECLLLYWFQQPVLVAYLVLLDLLADISYSASRSLPSHDIWNALVKILGQVTIF